MHILSTSLLMNTYRRDGAGERAGQRGQTADARGGVRWADARGRKGAGARPSAPPRGVEPADAWTGYGAGGRTGRGWRTRGAGWDGWTHGAES